MKLKSFMLLLIMEATAFSQSITIVSPNGGEIFTPGQQIAIRWTSKPYHLLEFGEGFFSVDNGVSWTSCGTTTMPNCDSVSLTVPYSKRGSNRALVKVKAWDLADNKASDVSDGNFTIQGATPDAYEPNDDFASAYPITVGDSAVKNAFFFNGTDIDTSISDEDFYKVTLTQGMPVSIFTCVDSMDVYANIAVYDSSKRLVDSGIATLTYTVPKSGVYYCKIFTNDRHCWTKYYLSIRQGDLLVTILSPNGGEVYNGGQRVKIRFAQGGAVPVLKAFSFSLNGGASWEQAMTLSADSGFITWIVPYLKERTDLVKIIVSSGFSRIGQPKDSSYDYSDKAFTILVSPPDAYEPNHDFASAYPIGLGDSVVKNAIVFGDDNPSINPSSDEVDYFKVTLTGGKAVTISAFDGTYKGVPEYVSIPQVAFKLYDVSQNDLGTGDGMFPLTYNITTSGIYYCKIFATSSGGLNSAGVRYGLSIHQDDTGVIKLLSPKGGERFNPGDTVTVYWTKDKKFKSIDVLFSGDNGARWTGIAKTDSTCCQWIVPYRNHRTDSALVLVITSEMGAPTSNSLRSVSGNFTILATAPDGYEPNEDFSSAYSIGMGDTVVKNAIVVASDPMSEEGPTYMPSSLIPDSTGYVKDSLTRDFDYFKVALTAGKLAIFSAVASCRPLPTPFYFYPANPHIGVYNASQQGIADGQDGGTLSFAVLTTGNYYCMISAYQGAWYKYDLSIKEATILSTQKFLVDSTIFQKIDSAYSIQLIADTTQVNIGLLLNQQVQGTVTTMSLSPDEIAPAADTKVNVKVVSISADSAVSSSIKNTKIVLSYNKANLNGYSEHSLKMLRMNDSLSRWTPLDCTVDTVKHQIVAQSDRFSIFGVFVPSNTAIWPVSPKLAPAFGIKANFLPQRNSIAVHFSLPRVVNADLRLYNIQGKCVRKFTPTAAQGSSLLMWNLGALANGKYFLNMKAGTYQAKEAILIME
jgi:hypothetical protein